MQERLIDLSPGEESGASTIAKIISDRLKGPGIDHLKSELSLGGWRRVEALKLIAERTDPVLALVARALLKKLVIQEPAQNKIIADLARINRYAKKGSRRSRSNYKRRNNA